MFSVRVLAEIYLKGIIYVTKS